jgi:hypothetical protein
VDLVALVGLGVYVLGMAILAVSTIVHEGRFTDYGLVEFVVFFALAVAAAYPPVMARRRELENGERLCGPGVVSAREGGDVGNAIIDMVMWWRACRGRRCVRRVRGDIGVWRCRRGRGGRAVDAIAAFLANADWDCRKPMTSKLARQT